MRTTQEYQPPVERMTLPGWRIPRARAASLDDCTLIVPTYRRVDEVISLLQIISGLCDAPGEVVIVDGSDREDVETALLTWVRDRQLAFDLIYVESPTGLTRQRNVGVDVSSRPYLFFLDDDCVPRPEYFQAIRRTFIEDVGSAIGAVAGWVIGEKDEPVSRRWRLRLALGLVPRIEPMRYQASGTSVPRGRMKPFTGIRPVDILPGCAMAFRRTVLEEIRFSEFFGGYAQGEDVEMSLRVGRHWKLVCCGDAWVVHKLSPVARPSSFRKGRMEVRNRFFICKRHSPGCPSDRVRFWLDVIFLILMDLAWFCLRPWRPKELAHAAGLGAAALECLALPPLYEEPVPATRYKVSTIN